jgi:hypothetical protein
MEKNQQGELIELTTGIPHFIALCFIALHRYSVFLQIEGLWQPCVE